MFKKNSKNEAPIIQDLKTIKRNKFITSVIFIVIGVILLVEPEISLSVICRLAGCLFFAGGAYTTVMYLISKNRTLVESGILTVGVTGAVIGLWIVFHPEFLSALVPTIIGILVVVSGVLNVLESLTIRKENNENFIIPLVLSVITIVLGILILLQPQFLANFIFRLLGIVNVYTGVATIWIINKITGEVRQIVKEVDSAEKKNGSAFKNPFAKSDAAPVEITIDDINKENHNDAVTAPDTNQESGDAFAAETPAAEAPGENDDLFEDSGNEEPSLSFDTVSFSSSVEEEFGNPSFEPDAFEAESFEADAADDDAITDDVAISDTDDVVDVDSSDNTDDIIDAVEESDIYDASEDGKEPLQF